MQGYKIYLQGHQIQVLINLISSELLIIYKL